MKLPKILAVVITILSLASILVCQTKQAPKWRKINAEGFFTFRLPNGFNKTDLNGVENYLGEYYKDKTRFLFIWGDTDSNSFDKRREPDMDEYQEIETKVDGKKARIQIYSQLREGERIYRAELNVGNWEEGEVDLYMGMESNNPADLEVARQIFNSIVFLKK